VKPTPRFPERTQRIHLQEKQETSPRPADGSPIHRLRIQQRRTSPARPPGAEWPCVSLSRLGEREREGKKGKEGDIGGGIGAVGKWYLWSISVLAFFELHVFFLSAQKKNMQMEMASRVSRARTWCELLLLFFPFHSLLS
jgi:hypothetical protein